MTIDLGRQAYPGVQDRIEDEMVCAIEAALERLRLTRGVVDSCVADVLYAKATYWAETVRATRHRKLQIDNDLDEQQ